ncbi:unnamed protein product [Cuscuta epithymum]|uniref:Uncharacterized protein n=1 Tax=Cuscuta epithymum TaxID=186058 RepID=A0AAV0G568_9ASTE|nr:unnamed protein product [Cuscuta epithymum]
MLRYFLGRKPPLGLFFLGRKPLGLFFRFRSLRSKIGFPLFVSISHRETTVGRRESCGLVVMTNTGKAVLDRDLARVMDSSLVSLVSIGKVSMDSWFIRAIIIGNKKMSMEIVVVSWQGMFQDEGLMIRPPPEPPPRRWMVVGKKTYHGVFIIVCFGYLNLGCFIMFVFCVFIPCMTLALRLGEGKSAVTVIGFKLPKFGLASYTAFLQVVSSQSRPRADGYLWFFSSFTPLLNAIFMN